jgi:hypothetical protein
MQNLTNIPIPARLRHLKLWHGFPITYVTQMNGDQPDFRTIDVVRVLYCMKYRVCGICGGDISDNEWICFIGGQKSAASRAFIDPPMHSECAYYAAKVCPYLAGTRREYGSMPNKTEKLGQVDAIFKLDQERPDRMCIYKCKSYKFVVTHEFQPICIADKRRSVIDWKAMPESRKQ